MSPNPINIGVLVSGGGTNLQAIIDAAKTKKINGKIVVVVSNRADAYALKRARKHKIEALFLDPKKYSDREQYSKALVEELEKRNVDLVCLAGFMCILSHYFVEHFHNRAMNIHPALLPAFGGVGMYGHHVHEAVIKSGVKYSGCTVHFVDEGCDTGPIILQHVVPAKDDDTPDTLAKRILHYEHRIYPQAIKLFSQNKLIIEGKRVKIKK